MPALTFAAEEPDHADAHKGVAVGFFLYLVACRQPQVIKQQHTHTWHQRQRNAIVGIVGDGIPVSRQQFPVPALIILTDADACTRKDLAAAAKAVIVVKGRHDIPGAKLDFALADAVEGADGLPVLVLDFGADFGMRDAGHIAQAAIQPDVKRCLSDAVARLKIQAPAMLVAVKLQQLILQEIPVGAHLKAPPPAITRRLLTFLSSRRQRSQPHQQYQQYLFHDL